LGNTDPNIQLRILDQVVNPRFVVVDSMDFWIEGNRQQVSNVFSRCDCVVLNDEEARLFGGHANIPRAVRTILDLGPTYVVVKRGEFGAALVSDHGWFFAPAYPLEEVVDPTGAGDAFAGAFLGSLAAAGATDQAALRRAVVYGSVVASFTVEAFSVDRLAELTRHDIDSRYVEFGDFAAF
jgi:sugar/nucleoside kinase (ribokinase family)